MRIGLLTSSRADFGIYYPLAKVINGDDFFSLEIIAFGTHLSDKFGYTLQSIQNLGFNVPHQIQTVPDGDSACDIAKSVGKTIVEFAEFWASNQFDLVLTLGDRYEMFAAVCAGSPFNVNFAHIHAGETTLGAIDNAYRHSISLMSNYLFVSTEEYKERGVEIIQNANNVFNVGALSVDNLTQMELFDKGAFKATFGISIDEPYILSTFHPETVSLENNEKYIKEVLSAMEELNSTYKIIITMPNADTMGLMIRAHIEEFGANKPNVHLVETFGIKGYLSCMKYCSFMLGNTSSGFVEAAFFPKWVINLGDRQKGRIRTPNIIDCEPEKRAIIHMVEQIKDKINVPESNRYGQGNTAQLMVKQLKRLYNAR